MQGWIRARVDQKPDLTLNDLVGGLADRQGSPFTATGFLQQGLVGFIVRFLPGRTPMPSAEQTSELTAIVEAGPDPETHGVVRWRRIDLCAVVERRFGIRVAERRMSSIRRLREAVGGRVARRAIAKAKSYKKLRTGAHDPA